MKICDLHTHSNNSFDADNSVDEMCLSAIDKGLSVLAITDHCEAPMLGCEPDEEYGDFCKSIPSSVSDTMRAKEKYSQKIKLLCGIELGEPMHDAKCTEKALSFGDYDFILASVHNLRNMPDFYFIDFSKADIDKILKLYFDELAETAEFEHFDSLAHLTYPLRYIKEKTGVVPDLCQYQDRIDLIYKILIKNNKALEINTSGLYEGFGSVLPDEIQIKRFKELGGRFITIGSDSHSSDTVGSGIKEGIRIAQKCGFSHYTIYEKRTPYLIEI